MQRSKYLLILLIPFITYFSWINFFSVRSVNTDGLNNEAIFRKIIAEILKDANLTEKPCAEEFSKEYQELGKNHPGGYIYIICAEVPHINTLDAALIVDPSIRKYLRPQSDWQRQPGQWERKFELPVTDKRSVLVGMNFGHPDGDYLQLVFETPSDELVEESNKPHIPQINKPDPKFLAKFEKLFMNFLNPLLKDAEINLVECPESIWIDRLGFDNELVLCGNFNGSLADFRNKFDVAAKEKLENTSEDDPMWQEQDKSIARRFTTDGKNRYVIVRYERKQTYNIQIKMRPNSEEERLMLKK
jgi:hypothetical protein